MTSLSFEGLGTVWKIIVDDSSFSLVHQQQIRNLAIDFENQYSRFKPTSEISRINQQDEPISISEDLYRMLKFGLELNQLTEGYFDLNINRLITGFGYDKNLSFKKNPDKINSQRGTFKLKGHKITKKGNVELDLGGIGKGYLIDLIAKLLKSQNHHYFLIDGGGDIYATTKSINSPWNVAIEHPLDPSLAINQIALSNQSLATSSSQKRKHQDFHHLLDPKTNSPVRNLLSVSVLASSATIADTCATAIFVSPERLWDVIQQYFNLEYFVVLSDLSYKKSSHFPAPSW